MKIKVLITLFTILLLLGLAACNKNKTDNKISKQSTVSMKNLEQYLKEDIKPECENPFVKRDFSPYLNNEWIGNAISYGPYREGQAPGKNGPEANEILEDLGVISEHWNFIRVYGADDDSERIVKLIHEYKFPIKVMLGVWLENETKQPERKEENLKQVLKGIEIANKYKDVVSAVNVGNETQVFWSWHKMERENLIKYLRLVRNNTSIPVTTADDYNFWNKPESKAVAEEVDFIVVHIYPLWNGKTLGESVTWMDSVYHKQIQPFHPEMTLVVGETGWATKYEKSKVGPGEQGTLIKGEVSIKAQESFLNKLYDWSSKNKITTFLFEAFDEPWKGGSENTGPNEVEKNWGVYYENRTPKQSFKNFLEKINER